MTVPTVYLETSGGYWRARWVDPAGARRCRGLGSRAKVSRRKATAAARLIEAELAAAPYLNTRNMTLGGWRERYAALRESDLDPQTAALHDDTFGYLVQHFGASKPLTRITRLDAASWRESLTRQPGRNGTFWSEYTVCRHVRQAKTIFTHARLNDLVVSNVFDRLHGTARRVRVSFRELSQHEVDSIVLSALFKRGEGWWRLVALCAYGGLRRGEALGLRWADVDMESRKLHISPERESRTKRRPRTVRIDDHLYAVLSEMEPRNLVCGVSQNNLHRNMVSIIEAAGVGRTFKKPFHTLRKWRATTWRLQYPEFIVDAWLGHGPEVARQHYAQVPEEFYR